jgi:predicted RNA-binding protein with RPS1 domain
LIHISELSREPVQNPGDAVKIGDTVNVKVLRVLPEEQKIGLSVREALLEKERESLRQAGPSAAEQKVTIGDLLAQKEKLKAEEEALAAEEEQEEAA